MKSRKAFAALVLAGMIAATIAVAGSQFNAKGGGDTVPSLEGSWEVTVMPDGADPIVDVATLTGGGGIINSDPDPNLSTGHGTWVRTGGDEFATTFVHFLSDGGAPLGTIKVRAVMHFDRATDTFSGPFRTDVIIGGNVVQSFCGTVHAKRISVEPIESCS
ncbi:MAG TPA: hypothetical protein VFU37_19620 [Pyrinomonadaceae bacterium]|nr:hypothetical protein [Pyrinomonadaceae bacterium]